MEQIKPGIQVAKSRLDWVDCAKGICIILVVMMHATHDLATAVGREGLMYYIVAFAKPFRMPDFFLISGLFLARVINRNWATYFDRKVLHFIYFYVLWVTIHFVTMSHSVITEQGISTAAARYFYNFVQPPGTLWFIYVLPLFFIITKLVRKVHPALVFTIAVILEVAPIATGYTVLDQSAARFVYFFAGYWLAPHVFALADWAQSKQRLAFFGVAVWALMNGALVFTGFADLALISLPLGFVGAAAIVTISVLLTNVAASTPIRYCGKNSIVIYLAFFLPMLVTRIVLLKLNVIPYVSVMALIVTTASIVGPLVLWWTVRNTWLSFLFVRPTHFSVPASSKLPEVAAATVH